MIGKGAADEHPIARLHAVRVHLHARAPPAHAAQARRRHEQPVGRAARHGLRVARDDRDPAVVIGDSIRIRVASVQGNVVRIGIEAPGDVSVPRQELVTRRDDRDHARPEPAARAAAPNN